MRVEVRENERDTQRQGKRRQSRAGGGEKSAGGGEGTDTENEGPVLTGNQREIDGGGRGPSAKKEGVAEHRKGTCTKYLRNVYE